MSTAYKNWMFCLPDNLFYPYFVCYEKFLNPKHRCLHNFWHYNVSLLKNIEINCPLHNTVQIDVLRIKPTVLYNTNSVIRKHFSTKFTVQYKPSLSELWQKHVKYRVYCCVFSTSFWKHNSAVSLYFMIKLGLRTSQLFQSVCGRLHKLNQVFAANPDFLMIILISLQPIVV